MTFAPTWTIAIPLVAALLSAIVAVLSRLQREIPGGITFPLMLTAVCEWMLCVAMQDAAVEPQAALLFYRLGIVGAAASTPLLVMFAVWYRDRNQRISAGYFLILWIFPIATVVLAATNGFHQLLWIDVPDGFRDARGPVIFTRRGPLFFMFYVYAILNDLIAVVLIASSPGSGTVAVYRRQKLVLVTGLFIPLIGGIVGQLPWVHSPGMDPLGLGFALGGLVLLLGMRGFSLMDIVPIARGAVIEKMSDGVIVLDMHGRIVDINPVAVALLGLPKPPIGAPASQVLGEWGSKVERLRAAGEGHVEAAQIVDPERWCDLLLTTLRDIRGTAYGSLLVIRDLTDRKKVEQEREKLIDDLGDAIEELNTLSGLLPICAACKKIRDDNGYWQQLEQYISAHSEAQFSHGICPDCAKKLYPGLLDEKPDSSS